MSDGGDKVAVLPTGKLPDPEASGEVIDSLQSLLADARSGKLVAIGVVGLCRSGDPDEHVFMTDWARHRSVSLDRLIGPLEVLKAKLVEHIRG